MRKQKTVETVISKISDRPAARNAALVVIYGAELGRKYDLTAETTVIGRSSSCTIQIDQEAISRQHARISVQGKQVKVEDLGSTNGTIVNDEAVKSPRALRNGDFIKIGRTIFKYLAGGNIEGLYHEEIYRLTTVDGLTQIFNKRYLLETLEREISRCRRYGRALSMLLLDIDHFKQVNDTYGHLAGDFVLKQLASLIKGRVRREDVFGRYGGEEFALIVPELELPGAASVAEKLRQLVEEQNFIFEDQYIPLTVSVGVAEAAGMDLEMADLLKAADARLYEAKSAGRNRVCS